MRADFDMPLPKSILCSHCKKTYPEGWKRCPYCGYDETRARAEAQQRRFMQQKLREWEQRTGASKRRDERGERERPRPGQRDRRPEERKGQSAERRQQAHAERGQQRQQPRPQQQQTPNPATGNRQPATKSTHGSQANVAKLFCTSSSDSTGPLNIRATAPRSEAAGEARRTNHR